MATLAPEISRAGWLDPFLASWRPGTGEAREIREPATGRPLLTLAQSTPEDVARAAARATEAQPAWADTSYAERAAVLRRAAEIYEAHRAEFGTWTQRETGAHRNKMHHEQDFTVQELLNASTLPSGRYFTWPSVTSRPTRRRVLGKRTFPPNPLPARRDRPIACAPRTSVRSCSSPNSTDCG